MVPRKNCGISSDIMGIWEMIGISRCHMGCYMDRTMGYHGDIYIYDFGVLVMGKHGDLL